MEFVMHQLDMHWLARRSNRRGTRSRFRVATSAAALGLLVIAGLAGCSSDKAELALPSLSREKLDRVRDTFNAGDAGARLIVFFSSGCASCETGSAALQKMLDTFDGPVTVFAVWGPISDSDPAPTARLLGNLTDKRVHQLWDPDHIISDEMRASELAHPGSHPQARTRTNSEPTGIMFETVALFRPGARWDSTLPAADYLEVRLKAALPEVLRRLVAMDRTK